MVFMAFMAEIPTASSVHASFRTPCGVSSLMMIIFNSSTSSLSHGHVSKDRRKIFYDFSISIKTYHVLIKEITNSLQLIFIP